VEQLQHFLMTITVTAALAVVLYSVFGIGESLRPPASGVWPAQLVYVSAHPDR
jgi:hypothetical protein